ncbi:MAG: NAD-dependent epimerase/dehydratase family protein [Nocardioidaceae bacterium]
MKVLLTGSAGFIGGAVAGQLEDAGDEVVRVDLLIPEAHAAGTPLPPDTHRVDVRDAGALEPLLQGVDVVCHQSAMVGAGVTVADLPSYASHNDLGTAVLLAAMSAAGVGRLVVASSMVVYGEGRYACSQHGDQTPPPRRLEALDGGDFENHCALCGRPLTWETVDESARLDPRSSYAASKVATEHYVTAWARQAPGAAVALRYHNVYGPGMPRDTPYSGVAALFRSAIEQGHPPNVFEDGGQMRDFVHVSDVARANVLSLRQVVEAPDESFTTYNVCSGEPVPIKRVAELVVAGTGRDLAPTVSGRYRLGDVRHIVASPQKAARELGFTARVQPTDGLQEFATAPLR